MLPHVHVSGIQATATFLFVVVTFGALKLLALSMPNSTLAQAWIALF